MPEEVNRVVVDRLASLLLTPSRTADATLKAEGEPEAEIVFVGNVMVDALFYAVDRARSTGFRHQVAAGATQSSSRCTVRATWTIVSDSLRFSRRCARSRTTTGHLPGAPTDAAGSPRLDSTPVAST